MKLAYFLLWLAGGGLVALEIYVCVKLLHSCESRQEADHEQLWDLLVEQGGS